MLNQGVESIKSVLETSKDLEKRGYQTKQPEAIDTLLDDALEQVTPILKDVTLSVKLKNMADLKVFCDKRMLTQVFVNLIRNAVESIQETGDKKGKISVTAKVQDQNIFVLKFSDNGHGIPLDVQEKLFKFKFSTKKDGMGIGLHLAKMILKIHNGDIHLESTPGKGSTFSIYLPLHQQ
jgi:signal transduction histidine kinase